MALDDVAEAPNIKQLRCHEGGYERVEKSFHNDPHV